MSQKAIVRVSDGRRAYEEVVGDDEIFGDDYSPIRPFPVNDISKYNGTHFVYGWWECFTQSDEVPMWVLDAISANKLMISVESYNGNTYSD